MLMKEKTDVIDYAYKNFQIKSFADLGGVWGVDGGYTFYTLEKKSIEKAFLVDTDFTKKVEESKKKFSKLNLVKGNFGSVEAINSVGSVDAVYLFDVLLHQVAPDWNEVIKKYAQFVKYFVIYNQQFLGSKTVRLIDLGVEEYFKNVPHTIEEGQYRAFIEKMYETHPQHNRIYRDIHNVWQWGITDEDLASVMKEQGFENVYYKNYGQWGKLKNFEGHSFIFRKI